MTVDAAARLSDARGAVENTQTLVSACAAVGYSHPDLTSHGAQITEWFACDDGLDLAVLSADCDRLQAALTIAEDAMRLEDAAADALNAAWVGAAGSDAADFVARHRRTVGRVVELLRSAASGCVSLHDSLWRIVDAKVAAAITIDDRRVGERSAWLAAARTLTTGGQDQAAAAAIIEKAVVPYVDSDIRIEWVDAMRSARASAAGAYRDVVNRLSPTAAIDFEVPIHLVPRSMGPRASAGAPQMGELDQRSSPSLSERELSIPPPGRGFAAAAAPEPLLVDPPAPPPQAMEAPVAAQSPGGFPSGLPGLPNLDGFGPGLAEPSTGAFDSLGETDPIDLGGEDGDLPGDDSAEESDDQPKKQQHDGADNGAGGTDNDEADTDEADTDEADTDDAKVGGQSNAEDDGDTGPNDAIDSATGSERAVLEANPPRPAQQEAPQPAPGLEADVNTESDEEDPTPCEIAADELPQVGE